MAIIGGGDMSAWKQKQITIQTAITLGGGFKDLMDANIPDGTTLVIILKDDISTHINNQLIEGFYSPTISAANAFVRIRNDAYNHSGGNESFWSNTYALTASIGDVYTILYQ